MHRTAGVGDGLPWRFGGGMGKIAARFAVLAWRIGDSSKVASSRPVYESLKAIWTNSAEAAFNGAAPAMDGSLTETGHPKPG